VLSIAIFRMLILVIWLGRSPVEAVSFESPEPGLGWFTATVLVESLKRS